MITLTAEVFCDRCKTVICSGEPCEHWRSAVESALRTAKAKGAMVGHVTVWCADCEIIDDARHPKSPPSPPPNQIPIES